MGWFANKPEPAPKAPTVTPEQIAAISNEDLALWAVHLSGFMQGYVHNGRDHALALMEVARRLRAIEAKP